MFLTLKCVNQVVEDVQNIKRYESIKSGIWSFCWSSLKTVFSKWHFLEIYSLKFLIFLLETTIYTQEIIKFVAREENLEKHVKNMQHR